MLKPIRNKSDYESSLDTAYSLMQKRLRKDSKESAYLEALSILIEAYEKEHFPIEAPHPIDAILFRLEQLNLTTADLKKYLGYRSRVSDILSGNRKLSLKMIRILHEKLNIPAEILIRDYLPRKTSKSNFANRARQRKVS
ncbi:MAG TPA: helix-turn-helix domain-containing protein [Saprospiraceae bacterium]|nr:helix-turn-helix domain-containing protein [Saprospiraceae bacterium]